MTTGFILKKIIATFLMPLPVGLAILALALYFLVKDKKKKAFKLVVIVLAWYSILSYGPVAGYLMYQLESAYPPLLKAPKEAKYIYVLGGGHSSDPSLPITSQVNDDAVIRLDEAIRLYHQLDEAPMIILSGYSGYYSDIPHAIMQQRLAIALGVDPKKLILRPKPTDTEEEAMAAKKLIGDQKFILVTSAYHMKRAMGWFKREGLHPAPAPTHHFSSAKEIPYYSIFSAYAFMISSRFFHEELGILWQKIKSIL